MLPKNTTLSVLPTTLLSIFKVNPHLSYLHAPLRLYYSIFLFSLYYSTFLQIPNFIFFFPINLILQDPIPASQKQINSEILSILNVAERLCPIHATLESIVITHTGTILALWQPSPGSTEPLDLRNKLQQALPQASKKQVVTDKVLLHTTLARIATTSTTDGDDINNQMERQLEKGVEVLTQSPSLLPNKEALWAAVESITREFCGTQTRMDALWYVEEEDLLALALNGRVKKYTIPFQCSNTNFETF